MKKIENLLILSLGSIGQRHLKIINSLRPEINIYVLRRSKDNHTDLDHLIKKVFTNIDDAIDFGFDAAIIASPSNLHISQAIKLIKNKIPTLIEKPLSNKLSDCSKLLKTFNENKTVVLVGYVLRYSSVLKRFREIILKEDFSKINSINIKCSSYLPYWRKFKNYKESVSAKKSLGGGALLELSHELDYANWIFGPFINIRSQIINSGKLDIDVEDEVKISANNKIGIPIKIDLDFYKKNNERYCLINLKDGLIKLDFIHKQIIYKNSNVFRKEILKEDFDAMYKNQIKHFFLCIEKGIKPHITLEDGISTMELINSVLKSNLQSV